MPQDVVTIKVSQVLQDLQNGLTRDDIGAKYGLNKAQVKRLFSNEKLKFKKTLKNATPFILEDDTEPVVAQNETIAETPVIEAATATTDPVTAPAIEVATAQSESAWPVDTPVDQEVAEAEAQADAFTQFGMSVQDDTDAAQQ